MLSPLFSPFADSCSVSLRSFYRLGIYVSYSECCLYFHVFLTHFSRNSFVPLAFLLLNLILLKLGSQDFDIWKEVASRFSSLFSYCMLLIPSTHFSVWELEIRIHLFSPIHLIRSAFCGHLSVQCSTSWLFFPGLHSYDFSSYARAMLIPPYLHI